MGYPVSPGVR